MSARWLLVWLDPSNRRFARAREVEIGMGHECDLVVAIQDRPVIAARDDVKDLLYCYGRFERTQELPDSGVDHGLQWRDPSSLSVEEMAAHAWHDYDARSIWLAGEVRTEALAASAAERLLSLAWLEYGERQGSRRPCAGLREPPIRARLRSFYDELERDLIAAKREGNAEAWARLDESLELDDGSVAVVEREMVDSGHIGGCYVASRYAGPRRWTDLIERYYFVSVPPEQYDEDEPHDLGTRPNLAEQVWLDYLLDSGDPEQRRLAHELAGRLLGS